MNERIKELYLQAVEYANNCNTFDPRTEMAEKFAELIVRKCAEVVTGAVDHREPASTYADKIKKHFGVTE